MAAEALGRGRDGGHDGSCWERVVRDVTPQYLGGAVAADQGQRHDDAGEQQQHERGVDNVPAERGEFDSQYWQYGGKQH